MARDELNPIFCSKHPGPWVLGCEAPKILRFIRAMWLSTNNGKDGRIIGYILKDARMKGQEMRREETSRGERGEKRREVEVRSNKER